MLRTYRLIDADCHAVEPPQLWETWLAPQFHDRAPRLVKDEEGADAWSFGEGRPLMYIGLVATPGMSFEQIKWRGDTYQAIRKGCYDGRARLEDMDVDGVDAEFLHPSQRTMYHFVGNKDREFHQAGVQSYNDWLQEEFCASDPERLFGLAQIPNLGVDAASAETKRCKAKGMGGVIEGPAALEQLDNFYWRNERHTGISIQRLPGDYVHSNWTCTFIRDGVGIVKRSSLGVLDMAWATGYPHHGNDWPCSRKTNSEMMDGVPAEERQAIRAGNTIRLYGMPQEGDA